MKWNFKGRKGDFYTKITSSTAETPIIPAYEDDNGVPIRANVYALILTNTSASVCKVTIRDSVGGGVRTVIQVAANATEYIGSFNPEKAILDQDTGNKPWTAVCASIDSMEITALFTKD